MDTIDHYEANSTHHCQNRHRHLVIIYGGSDSAKNTRWLFYFGWPGWLKRWIFNLDSMAGCSVPSPVSSRR